MKDRRLTIVLVIALIAIVVAKLVFQVRVAVLGFKYVLVLAVIIAAVALLAAKRRDDPRD